MGQAAYAIAKSGVSVLAESIAEENRGLDLTANVVAPSTLDTPANRAGMPDADFSTWVPLADVAASISSWHRTPPVSYGVPGSPYTDQPDSLK